MTNSHISNLDYKTAMVKGKKMFQVMHGESAVTRSPYFTPEEVRAMGYKRTIRLPSISDLSKKLDSLGDQGSNSHFINVTDNYTRDVITGETLVASDVRFMSDINVEAGILVAICNYSPTYKAKRLNSLEAALSPSLKHWSDIAFHQWAHSQRTQEGIRNLKFIIRLAQHQDQLGHKVIAGITIFYSDEPLDCDRALNLLFGLRDANAREKHIEKL